MKSLKAVNTDKKNPKRKLPEITYGDLEKPREVNTRSTENTPCRCTICKIGRMNGLDYKRYENEMRQKPGRPRYQEPEVVVPVTICSYCHSIVRQGKRHDCTRTEMQDNIFGLLRQKSEKTQEQVTSKMLDAIFNDKGVSNVGGEVTLSTKGACKSVVVGKNRLEKPRPKFTLQDLTKLQVSRNFSDKDTIAIASFLRVKAGKHSVEPHLQIGLSSQNHQLEIMYYMKTMDMKVKPRKVHDKEIIEECQESVVDG